MALENITRVRKCEGFLLTFFYENHLLSFAEKYQITQLIEKTQHDGDCFFLMIFISDFWYIFLL